MFRLECRYNNRHRLLLLHYYETYVVPACRPDGPAVAWAIAKEGGGGGGGGGGRGEWLGG